MANLMRHWRRFPCWGSLGLLNTKGPGATLQRSGAAHGPLHLAVFVSKMCCAVFVFVFVFVLLSTRWELENLLFWDFCLGFRSPFKLRGLRVGWVHRHNAFLLRATGRRPFLLVPSHGPAGLPIRLVARAQVGVSPGDFVDLFVAVLGA